MKNEVFSHALLYNNKISYLIASHKYPKFTGEYAVCSEEKYKLPRRSIKCGYDIALQTINKLSANDAVADFIFF